MPMNISMKVPRSVFLTVFVAAWLADSLLCSYAIDLCDDDQVYTGGGGAFARYMLSVEDWYCWESSV